MDDHLVVLQPWHNRLILTSSRKTFPNLTASLSNFVPGKPSPSRKVRSEITTADCPVTQRKHDFTGCVMILEMPVSAEMRKDHCPQTFTLQQFTNAVRANKFVFVHANTKYDLFLSASRGRCCETIRPEFYISAVHIIYSKFYRW